MNNYKIDFSNLRFVSECIEKRQINLFVDYLNDFEGINIFDKFKNLLSIWSNDVASHLTFKLGENPSNVSIKYLLSEMPDFSSIVEIIKDDVKIGIGVPDIFTNDTEVLPIYTTLKYINIFGMTMDFRTLPREDRQEIINSLPASTYNLILTSILKEKSKILSFSHPALERFKLNFLTNDPFMFIRSMFSTYDDFYFRDIVYHLSPKIGTSLMSSTIQDINYYIKKLSDENQDHNKALNI